MLVSALISFVGYFMCKFREERIGIFYFICPSLLLIAFFVQANLYDIIHAILRHEAKV